MNVHKQFADFFEEDIIKPYAYLVSKKLSEGNVCLNIKEEVSFNDIENKVFNNFQPNEKILISSKFVSSNPEDQKPFFLSNNRLYLTRYYNYETKIIDRIMGFIEGEEAVIDERYSFLEGLETAFVNKLASDTSPKYANDAAVLKMDWQLAGAINGFLNNFTIITGGPGTGKTTTVAKILGLLYKESPILKVALAAPTGKAGMRVIESLRKNKVVDELDIRGQIDALKPFTLHRLLGFNYSSPYFKYNESNYLPYDVLIVDEASMIDVAMFAKFLQAVDPSKRVIMLGDKNQLASVEAGSLFGDLCSSVSELNKLTNKRVDFINSGVIREDAKISTDYIASSSSEMLFEHVIELKKSHRFGEDSWIGKISKSIIEGKQTEVASYYAESADTPSVSVNTDYNKGILKQFALGYKEYINEPDITEALHKINNLKVLCAVREGDQGIYHINTEIEKILEASVKDFDTKDEFYENRPILVTKNDRELDLFNGDIGVIRKDNLTGNIYAWFLDEDGNPRKILPGFLPGCETVFAMTIHKSQGSEYNDVMVIVPKNEQNKLLTRELLYTGVTRAINSVIIQGPQEIVEMATIQSVERASGITKRIS